jgi:cell division topological specificity factor
MELKEVFEPLVNFLRNFQRKDKEIVSKDKAKERLQLVLMQDRASVSPDFFEKMKKELIEVIKKYIEIDEELLEVQLTRGFEDDNGTGPALYANIPIKNIKPVAKVTEEKSDEDVKTIEVVVKTDSEEKENEEAKEENIDKVEKETKENKEQVETKEEVVETVQETSSENTGVHNNDKKKEETKESIKGENIDNSQCETQENIDVETKEDIKEAEDEVQNETFDADKIVIGIEKSKDFKQRLNDVKEGVSKNFEKVKTSAKDGIKKIKSKVKAKN